MKELDLEARKVSEIPGLAIGPDGAPLVARDQRSFQLYAMQWQAP